jgi:CheY-like chemotaxis protein
MKQRNAMKQQDTGCPFSTSLLNGQQVYIIALTASASQQNRKICIDAGMDDFISKPFTMSEMKTALKTCVNKIRLRTRTDHY